MKTKKTITIFILFFCFFQVLEAQTLKSDIRNSVLEIGKTFVDIPSERLKQLDQIAFLIFRNTKKSSDVKIVMVDKTNQEISQQAMIWLRTGMIYYGHSNLFTIESAGVVPDNKLLSNLSDLKKFGFKIKKKRKKKLKAYEVDYGSGKWMISTKSLASLNQNQAVEIYLESISSDTSLNKKVELLFSDTNTIAREMLYIATRINSLIPKK
ncbi:hypothetical protein U8527_16745 [Kordia algicida OT-1]|uniref:Uncharacterized protein n=1 Tax=Kordia algicida OT-1 TaxID=391587 RepID=A9EB27_9FLAO|nr:hypothetical protein [Kordia algicida]EDP94571.1 hypothetical protein KAOT1_10426 [Kordia algicida OT-1]